MGRLALIALNPGRIDVGVDDGEDDGDDQGDVDDGLVSDRGKDVVVDKAGEDQTDKEKEKENPHPRPRDTAVL